MSQKSIFYRAFTRGKNELKYLILKFFGPAFSDRSYSPDTLLTCVLWQKILGVNRNVPWPVHRTSKIGSPHKIERGDRCPGLSIGCYIDGRNGIHFGKNVWVGPRVSIISMNHDTHNYRRYVKERPIIIGNNCWLGTGAIILPGVVLGNHVIVAAGAVVTKSFEENDILLAGIPAHIVKHLEPYEGEPTSENLNT